MATRKLLGWFLFLVFVLASLTFGLSCGPSKKDVLDRRMLELCRDSEDYIFSLAEEAIEAPSWTEMYVFTEDLIRACTAWEDWSDILNDQPVREHPLAR